MNRNTLIHLLTQILIVCIFGVVALGQATNQPINQLGFNAAGKFARFPPYIGYLQGDPVDSSFTYDPWGFDNQGIHKDTDKPYDENGHTQNQFLADQQLNLRTRPYKWVSYFQEYSMTDSLRSAFFLKRIDQVTELTALFVKQNMEQVEANIQRKRDTCELLRTDIRYFVKKNAYDSVYIYGRNNKYFNEELSLHFSQFPPQMKGVRKLFNRDHEDVKLEDLHSELIRRDFYLLKTIDSLTILKQLQLPQRPSLQDRFRQSVLSLSDEELEDFQSNASHFEDFCRTFIADTFSARYTNWRARYRTELDQL